MARFYASVQGSRGEVHRLGSGSSGIRSVTRGWSVGIEVSGFVDGGEDKFEVWLTAGSSGSGSAKFIGVFSRWNLCEKGE